MDGERAFEAPSPDPRPPAPEAQLEDIEIHLLLEGMYRHYGHDFRDYARASLKRRIWASIQAEGLSTVSGFQERVLHDPGCMQRFLRGVSINVTAMFRDPSFYRVFRAKVVPWLRRQPFVKLWLAGCSTGEEVYSLAILLREEGLYGRARIYATDMSESAIAAAKAGIYRLDAMQEYTRNYQGAAGKEDFSSYYTARYGNAILQSALKKQVVFAQHNLATDGSFNEFQVILCRNVMIYFNDALRARALKLFHESLPVSGVLGLGSKESMRLTPYEGCYEPMDERERLYRRVR